jgi:hypothetical protein
MMKKMKLADVPFGKNFEIWGHAYTVLDSDDKGVFVLETETVCEMPFREDEVDYKVAPNDFRDGSVRAYLEGRYTEGLVSAGAKLDEDILPMELDLKCTLGQHEYGVSRVHAGLLTLEQYGKYYDIIPKIDTPYWLVTPWKTPSRSPNLYDTGNVWNVYSNGNYSLWYYSNTYGVRPALTLSPSLLVSVECDEEEEVESKWHEYLEYLIHWAISHSDKGFAGCMPACYNEWLDSEGSDEE